MKCVCQPERPADLFTDPQPPDCPPGCLLAWTADPADETEGRPAP